MTDGELRGVVLQHFYSQRSSGPLIALSVDDVGGDHIYGNLQRICKQLQDKGLLDWHPDSTGGDNLVGRGCITGDGSDVMEGAKTAPISVVFDHSISIASSQNVQIGKNNTQGNVAVHLLALARAIDASVASPAEKAEAKSRLARFLKHPLVTAIAGGLSGAALGAL